MIKPTSKQHLINATRKQLVTYLQNRGQKCSVSDTTADLRRAALTLWDTDNS